MKPENSPPDDASSPPKADPQPCACCGDAPRRRDERITLKLPPEKATELIRGSMRIVYF